MKRIRFMSLVTLFLVPLLAGVLMSGCGNAKREAGAESAVIPTTQAATVGIDICTNCHAGQTNQWMSGQHSNEQNPSSLDAAGSPAYADFTDSTCANCHDQLGDGKRLTAAWTGNVPRPVVGCESCHGGGQQHFGVGPIAYPKPDHNRCGQCHNASFPTAHLADHPNGASIVESYSTSSHGNSINAANYVSGSTTDVEALCSRCHTDEGFQAYRLDAPAGLGHDALIAAMNGKANIANASPVECRTCHNPHTATSANPTRVTASGAGATAASSAFNTCTSCHQTADGFHGEHSAYSYDASGNFDMSRIIYDTHFFPMSFSGTPSSPTVSQSKTYPTYVDINNSSTVAYNSGFVKKADVKSCTASCHNPHSADLTVNRQWKAGAHGDPLKPSVDHTFSQVCVRCHLSTGFANLWTTNTSIAAWIISLTTNTTIPTNYQGQLKTCNACHKGTAFPTSANKELRKTGTIELVAEGGAFVNFVSDKPVYTVKVVATTPDMGESATCLTCHQGREAGDSVRANIDALASAATTTQTTNAKLKFVNEHYLAAGATLFGGDGHKAYEYIDGTTGPYANFISAQTYSPKHPHYQVGCVGCHMQNTGKTDLGGHSFMMDNGTTINNGICATCHTGGIPDFDTYRLPTNTLDYDGDGVVKGIHDELEGLKTALTNLFATKGIYYNPALYPYFHKVATGQTSSTGYTNWTQSQLKAAFNLNTFVKEPGAFAHNGKYAAELLIDAYTDLNGGTLSGSPLANAQRP